MLVAFMVNDLSNFTLIILYLSLAISKTTAILSPIFKCF